MAPVRRRFVDMVCLAGIDVSLGNSVRIDWWSLHGLGLDDLGFAYLGSPLDSRERDRLLWREREAPSRRDRRRPGLC